MNGGAVNIPLSIANDFPLPLRNKLWYERESVTDTTQTFRFAKRSDHTGILIKIDTQEFLESL